MIEIDELVTGERHEGIYYGLRSFLDKLTAALGSAVMGWTLAGFGYVGGAAQTPRALFGIRLLFCVVPAVILWACLPFLVRFPVTRKTHQALIEKLRIKQGL
jgi:GPH family glycoside/pentoside/hexuronide:cation symporter